MDDREALMWLTLCPSIGPTYRSLLLSHPHPQQAVAQARAKNISGPPYEAMQTALGLPFVTRYEANYPARLLHLNYPPPLLFYRGNLQPLADQPTCVTVVGTRRATPRGRQLATRFATVLAQAGAVIVSGLARGIDCAAHWASLDVANPYPVAVMACGLDVCYPSENVQLLKQIEARGIVFSEYPPGTPAQAFHFQQRNRLLAALAQAVLVIEAPVRSGVMLTVDHALNLGRDVFILPGALDQPNYEGNLKLLQEGALLARTPSDLITQLPGLKVSREFLQQAPAFPQDWARRLGLELPETLARLSHWERQGQMKRDTQGYFGWSGPCAGLAGGNGLEAGIGGSPVGSKGIVSN